MKITLYQKPTCTTCRQVFNALKEGGVDFDSVNYYLEPIPKEKLRDLLKKMGGKARDILRTQEKIYQEIKSSGQNPSEEEWLDLMVQYPDLIQRPIVEKGDKAVLARPAERLREIL